MAMSMPERAGRVASHRIERSAAAPARDARPGLSVSANSGPFRCCSRRSAHSCSSPAGTSRTSCSRRPGPGSASSPSAARSARRAAASCDKCSREPLARAGERAARCGRRVAGAPLDRGTATARARPSRRRAPRPDSAPLDAGRLPHDGHALRQRPGVLASAQTAGEVLRRETRGGSTGTLSRPSARRSSCSRSRHRSCCSSGSGLPVRSFAALQRMPLGFEPRGLVYTDVLLG